MESGGKVMNWREYVRRRLPPLPVTPEREIEIVEELAAQFESTYARARAAGASEAEALQHAASEVPDWTALAVTLAAYVATGTVDRQMLPMFAVVLISMSIPAALGARLYSGLSEATFRKVVLTLLTASGVALLVSAA